MYLICNNRKQRKKQHVLTFQKLEPVNLWDIHQRNDWNKILAENKPFLLIAESINQLIISLNPGAFIDWDSDYLARMIYSQIIVLMKVMRQEVTRGSDFKTAKRHSGTSRWTQHHGGNKQLPLKYATNKSSDQSHFLDAGAVVCLFQRLILHHSTFSSAWQKHRITHTHTHRKPPLYTVYPSLS